MAALQFLQPIDLVKNELRNAVIQVLSAAPGSPAEGQVYYDSTLHEFGYYNGTSWIYSTTVADATAGVKGIVQLANDLGGTAASPTVVGLHLAGDTAINHKLTSVTDPTAAQDASTKNYVDTRRLDQLAAPGVDLSMGTHKVINVVDPGAAQDAATKNYVDGRRLDQAAAPTADVSLNNHKLTSVTDPASAQDAATKNYVDGKINGIAWKQPVTCLAATLPSYTGGGSPHALTASANGALTVDGYAPVLNDRVLVVQTTAGTHSVDNGIYTLTQVGDGTHPWILSRASDAQTAPQLQDATVLVEQGTTYGDTIWNLSNTPTRSGTEVTFLVTGTTTNTSPTITALSAADAAKLGAGDLVTGGGIPANTYLLSVGSTTATMSAPATSSNSAELIQIQAAQTWVQVQSAISITADGVYLTRSGNTIQPVAVPGDPAAGANGSVVATAPALTRSMRFAIKGDGATLNFTLTHNFANRLVQVDTQKDNAGTPSDPIVIGWTPTSANAIQLQFVTAPTAGTVYYATVVG